MPAHRRHVCRRQSCLRVATPSSTRRSTCWSRIRSGREANAIALQSSTQLEPMQRRDALTVDRLPAAYWHWCQPTDGRQPCTFTQSRLCLCLLSVSQANAELHNAHTSGADSRLLLSQSSAHSPRKRPQANCPWWLQRRFGCYSALAVGPWPAHAMSSPCHFLPSCQCRRARLRRRHCMPLMLQRLCSPRSAAPSKRYGSAGRETCLRGQSHVEAHVQYAEVICRPRDMSERAIAC